MIEEYARHNGHADLLRESIDGATGEYPCRGPVAVAERGRNAEPPGFHLPSMRPASGIGEPAPARAYCLVLYGASDHAP